LSASNDQKTKSPSFEEAFRQLEIIADRLENGDVPLEESMALFEEGMTLVKFCANKLESAEVQLKKLVQSEDVFQLELMDSEKSSD